MKCQIPCQQSSCGSFVDFIKIKGNRKYKVSGQALSQEEKEEAKESGISPGKYRIISEIIELCPSYTVEELKNLPMAELNKIYKNLAKPSKKDSK